MEQENKNTRSTRRTLDHINSPADLKGLELADLEILASEIRDLIIETVSRNGGHLAPCLGVVELSIALHYVFDAPKDKIIWDVGHQAYAHKIITGRRDKFHTLRKYKGISGFPRREESPYDSFNTGHSGTSISAGLGITTARSIKGNRHKVIAVIGDGSMTAGMAFEALNQTGHTERDLIVVLNDNEMSIAKNVGALSSYISRKIYEPRFVSLKKNLENFFRSIPGVGENIFALLKKSEDSLIGLLTPGMLFEALKFRYIGPIKGHDLNLLIKTFKDVAQLKGPVLVHVLTTKGKGYEPAEKNPTYFHGIGSFDIATGLTTKKSANEPPSYTEVFGRTMVELGAKEKRLFAITAAMPEGTGLTEFARVYPDRFIDVGIAEQNMIGIAAGLAASGKIPFASTFAVFAPGRCFDQIRMSIAQSKLNVKLVVTHGGLSVGEDGTSHQAIEDLSLICSLPGFTVIVPADAVETVAAVKAIADLQGPCYVRLGRPKLPVVFDENYQFNPGKVVTLKEGTDATIIAIGIMVTPALEAAALLSAENINCRVLNMSTLKPVDEAAILKSAAETGSVITAEEHLEHGGLGSTVARILAQNRPVPVEFVAIRDTYASSGKPSELLERFGLTARDIAAAVRKAIERKG